MTISEEKINANFLLWISKLKQYDCYSETMIEDIGDRIKNASFSLSNVSDSAYQGSMLNVVLNTLCAIACHINENAFGVNPKKENKMFHPELYADKNSLMKVLLLQHISKSVMFAPERSEWKVKNGYYYCFDENLPTSLKCGERTVFMCAKYGIQLTEEEYDAIKVIDKEDDMKNFQYMTPLSYIVRVANQLTAIELYRKNLNN